ncbi:hypothetical protein [Rufibacter soli]
MNKVCIRCNIEKPLTEFFKDRRLRDGHFGRCKECSREWVQNPEVKARRSRQSGESIRRAKEKLTDNYVARQLCHHTGLTPADVRQYPELIEATRTIIKTNRIIRDEKRKEKRDQERQEPTGEPDK